MATVRPGDKQSQIMKKVKKGIVLTHLFRGNTRYMSNSHYLVLDSLVYIAAVAKRHVSPSVMDMVLADAAAADNKSDIVKHIRRGKLENENEV